MGYSSSAALIIWYTYFVTNPKWITTDPNMAGVVGGDVGRGTHAGDSFQPGAPGSPTFIEAFYHFKLGGRMS
jgi:hypothetical protein